MEQQDEHSSLLQTMRRAVGEEPQHWATGLPYAGGNVAGPKGSARRNAIEEAMKEWLKPFLSNYRWFRRWHGGKWALSYIDLPLTNPFVWHPGWGRPGCGVYWLEREDWSAHSASGTRDEE